MLDKVVPSRPAEAHFIDTFGSASILLLAYVRSIASIDEHRLKAKTNRLNVFSFISDTEAQKPAYVERFFILPIELLRFHTAHLDQ